MIDKHLLTPITRGRTLSMVALYACGVGAYSLLAIWNDMYPDRDLVNTPLDIQAALTLVLGWLLVFRTNTAYSRWWEARQLWGSLVNASRNLAQKTSVLTSLPVVIRGELQRAIVAFPFALRDHLREGGQLEDCPGFETATQTPRHVPGFLVAHAYRQLRLARAEQAIDGHDLRVLDQELKEYMNICGGCERIRRTRVVRSYRVFARQCVVLYMLTLPWAISNTFGWWTVPVATIIAYFMIGLETVAEHVEEPFGRDEDDLDLDGMCATIRDSVNEVFTYADAS